MEIRFIDLEDLIIGSIVGDGCLNICSNGTSVRYVENHSIKQEDYLMWKIEHFRNAGHQGGSIWYRNNKTKYKGRTVSHRSKCFELCSTELFKSYRTEWYPSGEKQVPYDFELNPDILSVWYMDDGEFESWTGFAKINTNGFNLQSQHILQRELQRYDIKSSIAIKKQGNKKKTYYIYIPASEAWKLLTIVEKNIVPCMQYKVPDGYYMFSDCTRRGKPKQTLGNKYSIQEKRSIIINNLRSFYEERGCPNGFPLVRYRFWENSLSNRPILKTFGSIRAALIQAGLPSSLI